VEEKKELAPPGLRQQWSLGRRETIREDEDVAWLSAQEDPHLLQSRPIGGATVKTKVPELEALVNRVEKLERENRWLKRLGFVAFMLAAGLISMGQARGSRIVEASKFVLKDASGQVRAELGTAEDSSPSLVLFDARGSNRASLDLNKGGEPALRFETAMGKPLAELSVAVDSPRFSLFSPKGDDGVTVWTAKEGGSGLLMYGPDGLRVGLTDRPGKAFALKFEPNGKPKSITEWSLEGPTLQLFDPERWSARFGVTAIRSDRTGETSQTSAASIMLFDKEKNVIWRAP